MKQLNENIEVKFYENVEDNLLNFAVIVSKSNGKWVFFPIAKARGFTTH